MRLVSFLLILSCVGCKTDPITLCYIHEDRVGCTPFTTTDGKHWEQGEDTTTDKFEDAYLISAKHVTRVKKARRRHCED